MDSKYDYLTDKNSDKKIVSVLLLAINDKQTLFDFRSYELGNKTNREIAGIFHAIPASVTTLDLRDTCLFVKTGGQLVTIMAEIPCTINSVYLNGFGKKPIADLIAILHAIPSTVTNVDVDVAVDSGLMSLITYTSLEMIDLLKALPVSVRRLELSGDISKYPSKLLVNILKAIPATVNCTALDTTFLEKYSTSEKIAFLTALPSSTKRLNLIFTEFSYSRRNELKSIVHAIPSTVNSIDLGVINLSNYTSIEATEFINSLPHSVKRLDLSISKLKYRSYDDLVDVLMAIPAHLEYTDLGRIDLSNYTTIEIINCLKALPPSIKTLNLDTIDLYKKTLDELVDMMRAIPSTVTSVNANCFRDKSSAETYTIISAIAPSVLKLNNDRVNINNLILEYLSIDITNLISKLGILKFSFETIPLFVDIDDERLNQFIRLLEKQNQPLANFTCGLLLQGQIESSTDIFENCSEYDDYLEKRHHDAISFYTKAAVDSSLKPIVEFLLWEMKLMSPFVSIQNRLACYDVTPQDTYLTDSYNKACHNRLSVEAPLLAGFGFFSLISPESTEVKISHKLGM